MGVSLCKIGTPLRWYSVAQFLSFRAPSNMLQALEEQLSERGNHVATMYKGRRRTFRDLNLYSRRVADGLCGPQHMGPELLACVTDADDMVIASLASLRLGTRCTPLRASLSPTELTDFVTKFRPRFVLVDSAMASRLPHDARMVNVDEYLREGTTAPKAPLQKTCPPGLCSMRQAYMRQLLQVLGDDVGDRCSLSDERCLRRHQWEWTEWPATDQETTAVLDNVDSARFWEDVFSALCSGTTVALAAEGEWRAEI
ncbi:uncharacterized protein LOC144173509 [Haemaphysalis longicornis]